ncbi:MULTISPECIES: tyrosine-type recombinase/integrase [unclassified Arthrobacter]|uniref:tyrosine-type recombinase/integrase n=1 Tax=unclassified Arthrobacter TaxID=235627 RepID=UPI003393E914
MTGTQQLGPLIHSFFIDHLVTVKGLRPASVHSYSDTVRLLLCFVAEQKGTKITRLTLEDLSLDHVLGFLRYLENDRHNHVRTRNQRLAALHTLFEYIASREPAMLETCQRIEAIPMKRAAPGRGHRKSPNCGSETLQLVEPFLVRLHGKGDKWRTCPLWDQTAKLITALMDSSGEPPATNAPVFCSATGEALTRFGIYKAVRRLAGHLDDPGIDRTVSPHVFRHTAAMHLLESGVEINVIRGWLGHADLTTTNRYAEINTRTKMEALRATEPPDPSAARRPTPVWRSDESLLNWLSNSDRYVARIKQTGPARTGHRRLGPHNHTGHTTLIMFRGT